jgi:EAL domain-containing protein (putative c-di-GMP-specific phosphodiesterase class I)
MAWQIVMQPIVSLADGSIVGDEALTRFADGRSPIEHFFGGSAAERFGLEARTLSAAVAAAKGLPRRPLFVNASADFVTRRTGLLRRAIRGADRPIVLELSERVPIERPERIRVIAASLKVTLALDDVTPTIETLITLIRVNPGVVKLASDFLRSSDRYGSLIGIARYIGATLVAEGIETDADADLARRFGIDLGQGYHFGRPEPVAATEVSTLPIAA